MQNYNLYPWMIAAPVLGLVMSLLTAGAAKLGKGWLAFLCSSLAIAGIILTAGFSMFPFIMPSSTDPVSSLTLWDAVSSKKTLGIMFIVTLIFLPLILIYTSWVFRVLRGKITVQHIRDNSHTAY